ncbi:MAG: hypothetical protein Q4P25_05180 [Tissierellia bacterium]|nr:hypothetical protein [Tissierellia bacterium]
MRFIRFILDTIYDLYQYILILLIVAVISLVLYSSIQHMFSTDYNQVKAGQGDTATFTEIKEEEESTFQVTIPEGFSLLDISKVLIDSKVIKNEEEFIHYIKDNNKEDLLVPGEYQFSKNMEYEDIVHLFEEQAPTEETEAEETE